MVTTKLEYFRDILNSQLDVLLSGVEKTVSTMVSGDDTPEDDNFPDPTDRASLETDRNFTLRVKDRERKLVVKVKQALSRIEDGTYGICDICEEEISEKRLEARPVTTSCIECKTEEEAEEKQRG
ncbi:MAG: RNA polymerase-binding protein DksA [Deltaproteobacteria bacterium]|nr:RNA polymerase-binding protein DksA [Deltaproteobacteria bacterium]